LDIISTYMNIQNMKQNFTFENSGCHGHDCMIAGFTTTNVPVQSVPITNKELYSIQHYVIKFASDLQLVGDFLWVLQFPSLIKLTTSI